jgi:Glycosyltransferase like family
VMARRGLSLQRAYNEMLEEAAAHADLEAVVIPHQDMRIEAAEFGATLRGLLADESIALIGASGGRGGTGLAWWDGAELLGWFGAVIEDRVVVIGQRPHGVGDADVIDGTLLIFSAWAAHNLRFDLRFEHDFHGYDSDISFQARALGKRVVVADLWCVHDALGKIGARRGGWVRAALEFDRKWGTWTDSGGAGAPRRRGHPAESVRDQIDADVAAALQARRG